MPLIQNPPLHLVLYGDPALPEESNRGIFDHVHNYVLKSRRSDANLACLISKCQTPRFPSLVFAVLLLS